MFPGTRALQPRAGMQLTWLAGTMRPLPLEVSGRVRAVAERVACMRAPLPHVAACQGRACALPGPPVHGGGPPHRRGPPTPAWAGVRVGERCRCTHARAHMWTMRSCCTACLEHAGGHCLSRAVLERLCACAQRGYRDREGNAKRASVHAQAGPTGCGISSSSSAIAAATVLLFSIKGSAGGGHTRLTQSDLMVSSG